MFISISVVWFVGAQYEDLSVDQENAKLLPLKFGLHKLYSLSDVLGKGSKSIYMQDLQRQRIEELMQ